MYAYIVAYDTLCVCICVYIASRRIASGRAAPRRPRISVCMYQRSQKHVTLTQGTRIFDTGSSHDKLIGDVAPLSFGMSLPRSNEEDPSEGHVRYGGLYRR